MCPSNVDLRTKFCCIETTPHENFPRAVQNVSDLRQYEVDSGAGNAMRVGIATEISNGKCTVIRNWPCVTVWLLIVVVGFTIFVMAPTRAAEWSGLGLSLVSAWLLCLEARGIIVETEAVSFPVRPFSWFPVFTITRLNVSLGNIERMVIVSTLIGMEIILMKDCFGKRQQLIFHNRSSRRAFCKAVKLATPRVSFYKAT
jgi:hypothetical protein